MECIQKLNSTRVTLKSYKKLGLIKIGLYIYGIEKLIKNQKIKVMTFNELKSFAAKNHVNTNKMNRAQIEQALAEANLVYEVPSAKRGRKVNLTSARQIRLARMGTVKRGRPVEISSARQARLIRIGTVKRGRPVNPNSVRQIALNAVKSAESTDIQTA